MKRRNFLKTLPAAGVSSFFVNGFSMKPFANRKIAEVLSSCDDVEDRVLILIQLKGGNDGMNTIIPFPQYDRYAELRPVIKIPETGPEQFIRLDTNMPLADQVGLHPVMTGFKDLYDRGWMKVVQAVGYENINQSHFKGTDIWLSGGDGTPENSDIHTGWMGRALNAMYPDVMGFPIPDFLYPLGIQIGDPYPSLGFHTDTEHRNAINLYGQDPEGFYSLIQTIGGAPLLNVPDSEYGVELEYIMGVEDSINQYSQYITQAFNAGSNSITDYPQNGFANQLKTVARLIKGGCKTKIYLCSMGGFDTHGNQIAPEGTVTLGGHADLLRILSDGIKTFFDDLDGLGLADHVMACTFSEFGRCARENGSSGTDHGTLAPMFVFGKGTEPGIEGTNPDLDDLAGDNQLQGMQFDYRQVFTTLLQDWLGAGNEVLTETMFEGYNKIPAVTGAYVVDPDCYLGTPTSVFDTPGEARPLQVFPSPARVRAEISFTSQSVFDAGLSIHSLGGSLISNRRVQIQSGTNQFYINVSELAPGPYFVRLQDNTTGAAVVTKFSVIR